MFYRHEKFIITQQSSVKRMAFMARIWLNKNIIRAVRLWPKYTKIIVILILAGDHDINNKNNKYGQ